MPSINRRWSGDDYARAARVLDMRTLDGWSQLPRIGRDSDALFARLVTDQNLGFYRNSKEPQALRINQATAALDAVGKILQLYVRAFDEQVDCGRELLDMLDLTLRLSEATLSCMDEMVLDLDLGDPQYPARIFGTDQLRKNLAEQATGAVELLASVPSGRYREKDLLRFARELTLTLPSLVTRLPINTQEELYDHLQRQAAGAHGAYQRALKTLSQAVGRQVLGAPKPK